MKASLERCTAQLQAAGVKYPWRSRRAYGDWLAQTYYYVRHSTRLLAAAAARFGHEERGDALHHRFAAHIGEEKRHEQLALHDLKQLRLTLADFEERHSTRMFYEPQYFKIAHQAPSVLFGYILPLEAIGPAQGKHIIAEVTSAFGPKCAAFLEVHTDDDVEHLEKALKLVEAIPEPERGAIARNLEQTTFAYCCMLEEITRAVASAADA